MGVFYLFIFLIVVILFSPFLLAFFFFYIAKMGLDFLSFSPQMAFFILLLILVGSFINIPLGKRGRVLIEEKKFFGAFRRNVWRFQGVSINVGGALIPLLVAGYFIPQIPLNALLITTLVTVFFSFLGARFVQRKGIVISMILPVLFASFFAIFLSPEHASQVAFSAGVLGVLIGADILYLPWAVKKGSGVMSIGGAGIFDGIFLVAIASAILAAI